MNQVILINIFNYIDDIIIIYKFSSISKATLQIYRDADLVRLIELRVPACEKLQIFLNFYKYLPPQGTLAWKLYRIGNATRPPVIGGSEIGTLLELDPYKTPVQLLESKLGLSDFVGSTATRWGNLFEDMLFNITDTIFGIKSYETGSIPGLRSLDNTVMTSYSPDRLGVISKHNLINGVKQSNSINKITPKLGKVELPPQIIVLFEGKCPLTRMPLSEIPRQYTAQPLVGACTIPIT